MANKKTAKYAFGTWREDTQQMPTNNGSGFRLEWSAKYDKKGCLVVEEVGKVDQYARIQSFKDDGDILQILKRYENGDTSVLARTQGIYLDATNLPENMADMMNKLNKAQNDFEKLPAEIKQKYGNDFIQFMMTYEPVEMLKQVDKIAEQVEKKTQVENKTKEKTDES